MASSGDCGCAAELASDEPIVCLLAGREAQEERLAAFRALFLFLEHTDPRPGGFRWIFRGENPDAEARVRELAAKEQACCPFFRFSVYPEGAMVVWDVTAPERAHQVMAAFMLLPETLRAGVDAEALKLALTDAGLHFTEDEHG